MNLYSQYMMDNLCLLYINTYKRYLAVECQSGRWFRTGDLLYDSSLTNCIKYFLLPI